MSDEAKQTYEANLREAQERLERIRHHVEQVGDHLDVVNWGHVGSMDFVNQRLKEIEEHLNLNI